MSFQDFSYIRFIRLFVVVFLLTGITPAQATHSAGADISYRCLGGLSYEVTVTFYRDCGGVAEPASITINYRSQTAGVNLSVNAGKVPGYGNEITQPCAGTTTNCNGGNGTGIREWKYSTIITLPNEQPDWVFSYSVCCRNCAITTIQSPCAATSVLYVEAKLNNQNGVCNNAPVFTNIPVAYVCLGQNYNYNHGVIDQDGDSLTYSLIAPKTSAQGNVNFISPYSVNAPISSSTPFTLDAVTGDLNFTPSQLQIGILAILIKEYRNGVLIGSVVRDMQIYINPCSNTLPTLSGINGTNNFTAEACPGQPLCFTLQSADIDASQLVSLSSNQGIAGASYTINSGNRPSLAFCWTPAITDAGKTKYFTVTVKDNACPFNGSQVYSYRINVRRNLKTGSTPASCNGSNGTAWVNAGSSYSGYLWSTGATTAAIQNLSAGIYSVSVTTTDGCTLQDTITITGTNLLSLTTGETKPCQGTCNGSLTVTPTGGLAPFQYAWSNGNSSATISNLCQGNYSVTVTDSQGCTAIQNFQLNAMSALNVSTAHTDVNCAIQGTATVTGPANNTAYNYLWSNGLTTASISNLATGNYSVTVTSQDGCDSVLTVVIGDNSTSFSVSQTISPISCSDGNDGAITASGSGNDTYTYSWNTGATSATIQGLVAGQYTVTVMNSAGCSNVDTITLDQPDSLSIQAQINASSCNQSNGSVSLQISGGASPYVYQWNSGQTTAFVSGLGVGSFTVTVTDSKGCTAINTGIISGSNSIAVTSSVQPVSCYGMNNGYCKITPSGSGPFTYSWSDNSVVQQNERHDLAAGNYVVTVTDINGCSHSETIVIAEALQIKNTSIVQASECLKGVKGEATIISSGGESPYLCSWSDGIIAFQRKDLAPGTHAFSITDNKGCIIKDSVIIPDSSRLILETASTVICNGNKAHLLVNVKAEKQALQWFFNGKALKGANGTDFYSPAAGTYSVSLTNDCGTYTSNDIEITVSAPQSIQISNDQMICPGDYAELTAGGGIEYKWLASEGLSDSTGNKVRVTPLKTTVYSVIITDAQGCTAIASVTVTVICDNPTIPNGFSPNNDGTNDFFIVDGITEHPGNVIYIYNRWGNLVYKQKEYENNWNGQGNVAGSCLGQDLPDGTYYYIIDMNNNERPLTGFVILRR